MGLEARINIRKYVRKPYYCRSFAVQSYALIVLLVGCYSKLLENIILKSGEYK